MGGAAAAVKLCSQLGGRMEPENAEAAVGPPASQVETSMWRLEFMLFLSRMERGEIIVTTADWIQLNLPVIECLNAHM